MVNAADVTQVRSRMSTSTANPGTAPNAYTILDDVSGDGPVTSQDVLLVRNRQFTKLPAGSPAGTTSAASFAKSRLDFAFKASATPPATRRRLVEDLLS